MAQVHGMRDFFTMTEWYYVSTPDRRGYLWLRFVWESSMQGHCNSLLWVLITNQHQEFTWKSEQMLKQMTKGPIGTVYYDIRGCSLTASTEVSWSELFSIMTDDCSCCREWKMKGQCDQMTFLRVHLLNLSVFDIDCFKEYKLDWNCSSIWVDWLLVWRLYFHC